MTTPKEQILKLLEYDPNGVSANEMFFNLYHRDKEKVAARSHGYKRGREDENLLLYPIIKELLDALEKISDEKYEANPWTVVETKGAKIAREAIVKLEDRFIEKDER
jgi:hypothetical protein